MRIALITTPTGAPSQVGEYTRALLPHLRALCAVELFVEVGREREEDGARSVGELRPREFDQLLYQLGDEAQHGFMAPMVRALGGTVALHAWELGRLSAAAFPALARGGWRGAWRAAREGGLSQARAYRRDPGARLALNRSVVRHADAFVVHDEVMARTLREDRNAQTPVAVVDVGAGWAGIAARYVEALGRFPHAHSARRPLVIAMLRAAQEGRRRDRERHVDA